MAKAKNNTSDMNKDLDSKSKDKKDLQMDLECSICHEEFFMPKILSNCLHTFCLKCLEALSKTFAPGKAIPCPLCRREFDVPKGGVRNLQNNDLIKRLVLQKQVKEDKFKIRCEPCLQGSTHVNAEKFCTECKQSLCRNCDEKHASFNGTRDHKVVEISAKPNEEEVKKMMSNYCTEPSHEQNIMVLYCIKCNKLICMICSRTTEHAKHDCLDIPKAAKTKRDQVEKTRAHIQDKFSKQLTDIMSYKKELQKKFKEDEGNEHIKAVTELYESNVTELNRFLKYSRIVLDIAINYEIIREADELRKRAEQLIKSQSERNKVLLDSRRIQVTKQEEVSKKSILLANGTMERVASNKNGLEAALLKTLPATGTAVGFDTGSATPRKK